MNGIDLLGLAANDLLYLAASTTRLAVAFLMLPLFSNDLIPALVRNALFLSLAVLVFVLQPAFDVTSLQGHQWGALLLKEAFVGLTIGFFFGLFLWAFEAAGMVIDTLIGSSAAMLFDPLSGHEVTLIGDFIGRWINYVFLAAGGLMMLTITILESYAVWPLIAPLPDLRMAGVILFEQEFSRFMTLMLMIAGPALVVIVMIDLAMGLLNRFSQRLNVFFISISLKGIAAILVLMLMVPLLIQILDRELQARQGRIDQYLEGVLNSTPTVR